MGHGGANAVVVGTDVWLEFVEGVGEGIDAVYHKLNLGILLVVEEVPEPEMYEKIFVEISYIFVPTVFDMESKLSIFLIKSFEKTAGGGGMDLVL